MRETKPNFPGLVLGLMIHVSGVWILIAFCINILVFIYKGISFPYPPHYLGLDISLYVAWGIISLIRSNIGRYGIARMAFMDLIWFAILTALALVSTCYFAFLQTYCVKIEFMFNILCLVIEGLEFILGLVSGIMYKVQGSI